MKKAVSLMMAAAMTMGLSACGSTASTDTAASAADTASSTEAAASTADSTAAADGKVYNIGICQLIQHDALDAATKGFEDALTEVFGDNVKFDEQNAQGDSATCATIINGFVSNNDDLILANATAALQAAAAGTDTIPILGILSYLLKKKRPPFRTIGTPYQGFLFRHLYRSFNFIPAAFRFVPILVKYSFNSFVNSFSSTCDKFNK